MTAWTKDDNVSQNVNITPDADIYTFDMNKCL